MALFTSEYKETRTDDGHGYAELMQGTE